MNPGPVLAAALLTVASSVATVGGSTPSAPATAGTRGGFVVAAHRMTLANAKTASPNTAGEHALPLRTLGTRSASGGSRMAVRATASRPAAPLVEQTSTVIPLLSHDSELQQFGLGVEPPDTQLAAGPTQLVEAVNDVLLVTSKSGTALASADLNAFFGVNTAAGFFFSDPRVVFDAESGRWLISGLAFLQSGTTFESQVFLAASTSSDALAGFSIVTVDSDSTHMCDQPKVGVNTDKITLSCANFNATGFTDQLTFVINKAELLGTSSTIHGWVFDDGALFNPVPVVSHSPTTTAFMVENGSIREPTSCTSNSVVLTAFTGVPSAATPSPTPANRSDACLPMGATSVPPSAAQPAGGVLAIDTGDDRFVSATWQDGLLWTGGNDGCFPAGDSSTRSCMRLVAITTATSALTSVELGRSGFDQYYPAVTQDPLGDLFVSFTTSNSTTFASTAVVAMTAGSTTPDSPVILQAGSAAYQDNISRTRWGDYSAAAPDPMQLGNVWVTAEYAAPGVVSAVRNWFTATAAVHETPQATTISPASGSAQGGESVTISGSFFEPGATVSFGNNLATSVVTSADGTSITATTPSGPVGAVTVTVTNPDGSSTTVPGGFTYTAPAATGTTFFFAEGNTISGFDEELQLFTPNASGDALVTYFTETGSVGPVHHALTAGQVTQVSVVNDVGPNHTGVSAQVVLPGPGVAQRQLHFTIGNWHGSTDKVGTTGASSEWDFAEGSTLTAFSEYLTLQNPDLAADASVTLNYFTDQGAQVVRTLTLPHATRTTVEVFNGSTAAGPIACPISGGVAQSCGVGTGVGGVSTQVLVTSGPKIIAERPMYVNGFSFGSGAIRDGHVAFGASGPNTSWNFAEGTTIGGFNEYLTLQNPGTAASNVTIKYFTDQGQTVTRTLTLPATSRTTVEVFKGSTAAGPIACTISGGVAQSCGVGPNVGGVSTTVTASAAPGIVAERPMYLVHDFGTGVVAGATVVVGANSLGNLFGFAGSQTTAGQNDFLTIQNPNAQAAIVTIAYYDAAGGFPRTVTVVVPPATRQTVQMFIPPGLNTGSVGPGFSELGAVVSSNQPVLVERPTYSSISAQYGATDTLGFTPSPAF